MFGAAVIGCGLVSKVHLDALKRLESDGHVSLEFTCDVIEERAKQSMKKYGFKHYTTHYEDVSHSKNVDLAFVLLPVSSHHKVSIDLMNSGKNVLVEKPMALNTHECQEMIESMKKNKIVLYVGHVKRKNEAYRLAKVYVDKHISPVYLIKSCERWYGANHFLMNLWRANPSLSGGGIWMDIGCHYIDIFRYIVGEMKNIYLMCNMFPEDILKQIKRYEKEWQQKVKDSYRNMEEFESYIKKIRLEGNSLSSIEFCNGALGGIDVGWCTKSPEMYYERTEIFGHGGIIIIESHPFYQPISPRIKIYLENNGGKWNESFNLPFVVDAFYQQAKDFIKAVENGDCSSAFDGKRAIDIVQAGYLSFAKKQPIEIENNGDDAF
ncbi:MAG: Gfo/Idh/MocA family oxidoreductase [Candidatus Bathyarchaeia archaeon]